MLCLTDQGADEMEINIGMRRVGLMALAQEILTECEAHPDGEGIEVTRYVQPNGRGGELTLVFSNDDMEREDVAEDAAYWERFE